MEGTSYIKINNKEIIDLIEWRINFANSNELFLVTGINSNIHDFFSEKIESIEINFNDLIKVNYNNININNYGMLVNDDNDFLTYSIKGESVFDYKL